MIPYDMAAIRGLQTYLQAEVTDLQKVYDEWPYHGDKMVLPCCSIVTEGTPTYLNMQPYILKNIVDPDVPLNDLLTEVVAQIDGSIQVDVWSEYKIERGRILDKITKAINKQNIQNDLPNGLSLQLTDYYDVIARYDQVGYTYMDSEDNSQKGRWRVKINILFSHVVVEVKSRPRMSEITLQDQIADDINVSDDNILIEETYTI